MHGVTMKKVVACYGIYREISYEAYARNTKIYVSKCNLNNENIQ
jgi:hypothetical protein